MKNPRKPAPLPSRQQLLDFIKDSPVPVGKREIARAFRIGPDDRLALRALIKSLETEGKLDRKASRRFVPQGSLPESAVLVISGMDRDGELMAKPVEWTGEGTPPRIIMAPFQRGQEPLGIGDRVLARLKRLRSGLYEGRAVKRITEGPARVLGLIEDRPDGSGRLRPVDRRNRTDFAIAAGDRLDALSGELVLAEILPSRPYGPKPVRVVERLGAMDDAHAVSLLAIHAHGIPDVFPEEALAQAEAAVAAPLGQREDLRALPLITIDGADARDFDDAVWAEREEDGWHLIVAIADVAWYVRPGDALDREAYLRGNSVYFPDRVVPMLPEALSNGWCSLKPDEDRPCLAVHIHIDAQGEKTRHRFVRALMRSAARLTYEQVQDAREGRPDDATGPLLEDVLTPLYGAWEALLAARKRRGVLELDIPERRIVLDSNGHVQAVLPRQSLESHRLIEDFMIAANVAAAEQIEALGLPCMYRVHDKPSPEKLEGLREFLDSIDLPMAKGQVMRPSHFNAILAKVRETPEAALVNEIVLRSQAQAAYSPDNIGHFGLGLARYAHFTSPIRRYADLLVHRALIAGLKFGEGGLPDTDLGSFAETGTHISATERRAASAEREAIDRFTAAFLKDRVGAHFAARISGVARFGLFVSLEETGADGLIPASALPADYYHHDARAHSLTGRRSGARFTLGQSVEVILSEANPLTGGLVFALAAGPGPRSSFSRGPKRPGKGRSKGPERRGRR